MNFIQRLTVWGLIAWAVIFVVVHPLAENQYGPTSDEGYYFSYAKTIKEEGVSGFNKLINWYAASEEARFHPAPLRIGYIILAALGLQFLGDSITVLGCISTVFFVLFLMISYRFCRKYWGEDKALIFLLFLSASPLILGMSRRGLIDGPVNFFWALAAWLFLDYLHKADRRTAIGLIVTLTAAILFKEVSVILIGCFFIYAIIHRWKIDPSLKLANLAVIFGAVGLLTAVIYLITFGGVNNVLLAFKAVYLTHFVDQANPYAIYYSSGPWYKYFIDFFLLSAPTLILFLLYSGKMLLVKAEDWKKYYWLFYATFIFMFFNSLQHSKVVRFLINLETVMCLFSVFLIWELFKFKEQEEKVFYSFIILSSVAIFCVNYISFIDIFYHHGLLDPITYNLLRIRELVPPG